MVTVGNKLLKRRAKKILFGNLKGGAGKTTSSVMIAYCLAALSFKTLLVDLDPQANATSLLLLTAQAQQQKVVTFSKTLMAAVEDNNIKQIITKINDNLFVLPSFIDFQAYPFFLEDEYPNNKDIRNLHLKKLVEDFEDDYDFIIFDTPPTPTTFTYSGLLATDYVVIALQTQERSFVGAEAFIDEMQKLLDKYGDDADFDILGILPVLQKNNAIVDKSVIKNATEAFGEHNMFKNVVKNMERLKRYDITGIIDPNVNVKYDRHDKNVHELFMRVTKELLERLEAA